jgi:hypothetical protein
MKSPAFTGRPRVLAMVTLRRFTTHFHNHDFMDLMTSPLGQWCVASLNSSSRELRVAAGYVPSSSGRANVLTRASKSYRYGISLQHCNIRRINPQKQINGVGTPTFHFRWGQDSFTRDLDSHLGSNWEVSLFPSVASTVD